MITSRVPSNRLTLTLVAVVWVTMLATSVVTLLELPSVLRSSDPRRLASLGWSITVAGWITAAFGLRRSFVPIGVAISVAGIAVSSWVILTRSPLGPAALVSVVGALSLGALVLVLFAIWLWQSRNPHPRR